VYTSTVTSAGAGTRFSLASRTATWTGGPKTRPATPVEGGTSHARWSAAPGCTAKVELVSGASQTDVAMIRKPAPTLPTVMPPNVATPADALALTVPPSAALAEFGASTRVTVFVALVARLPKVSCTATRSSGTNDAPATMVPGS
jgi:hypothetical protein